MEFSDELNGDVIFLTNVMQEHLTWYANVLIGEAHDGNYDLTTRRSFLVAVGANALYAATSPRHIPYRPIAETVLSNLDGAAAVKNHDRELAHWNYRDWDEEVRAAFKEANENSGGWAQDDSFVGYIEVLEALRFHGRDHGLGYAKSA